MNEVISAIKARRSVRSYRGEQIAQETLEGILEAGMYAPTACNEQPWHFTVIQSAEALRRVDEFTNKAMAISDVPWHREMSARPSFSVTYGAPTLIVVSGRKDATAPRVDCAAAAENMMIAAASLGVGSVWLGLMRFAFADAAELSALALPPGYEPYYGIAFGYPASGSRAAAPKRNRDVVTWIR